MRMPELKLSGKPDAGNPPVRFDEGRGGGTSAPLLLYRPQYFPAVAGPVVTIVPVNRSARFFFDYGSRSRR